MQERWQTREAIGDTIEEMNSAARSALERNALTALSNPYWNRLWIAQELLLAKEAHLWLQNQTTLNMDTFAELVVFILSRKDQTAMDTVLASPGYKFIWWYFTTADIARIVHGPIHLASLLPRFADSKCQVQLDRVYALLAIAQDGDKLKVDYSIDIETLFIRTMEFSMDGRAVDDLLLVGADLLEVLSILPSADTTHAKSIPIASDGSSPVSKPMFSLANLYPSRTEAQPVPCAYVTIRHRHELHVFEYAFDPVTHKVTYCRTHEYLEGTPQLPTTPATRLDKAYYIWTSLTSEETHYFARQDHQPEHSHWTSQPLVSAPATTTAVLPSPSRSRALRSRTPAPPPPAPRTSQRAVLSPSLRSLKLGLSWDAYFSRATSRLFTNERVRRVVESSIWAQLEPSPISSNALVGRREGGRLSRRPPCPRACSLRVQREALEVRMIRCVRAPLRGLGDVKIEEGEGR
jgi:hypothetical protein